MNITLSEEDIVTAIDLYLSTLGIQVQSIDRTISPTFSGNKVISYNVIGYNNEKTFVLKKEDYLSKLKEAHVEGFKKGYREGYTEGKTI